MDTDRAASAEAARQERRDRPTWLSVAIPGVAMCLGWGLRGQFGGPRGAMVPGALVAFALALVSRTKLSPLRVWLLAAAGALGFGIGAEETYAQTIGLTRNDATALWGYLGLLIKGIEWGGLGGLLIGLALTRQRYSAVQLLLTINGALAPAFVAYWVVNVPKLVYFSGNPGTKPRPEAWAALIVVWLVLTLLAARAGDRTVARMSLFGALGCGIGFPLFQLANEMGFRHLQATQSFIDWWKVMECGLGLSGGLALGWAWATADQPAGPDASDRSEHPDGSAKLPPRLPFAVLCLDLLVFFYVADLMDGPSGLIRKAPFLFIVPALWLVTRRVPALQLAVGGAMPVILTFWNVQAYWVDEHRMFGVFSSVAALAALTVLAAWIALSLAHRPRALFLFAAWTCVACAWLKMLIPAPGSWGQALVVQGLFTVMAAWLTFASRSLTHAPAEAICVAPAR